MKPLCFFFLCCFLTQSLNAHSSEAIPHLSFEYSYGIDSTCAQRVDPEPLPQWTTAMIEQIPTYRKELFEKIPFFQSQWDKVEPHLFNATVSEIGVPFSRREYSLALLLCPRIPSMGTPLLINMISYLESSIADIPNVDKPSPVFLFTAIVFHEILHKYVNNILKLRPSKILKTLPEKYLSDMKNPQLVTAHLHLFAVRKKVYEKLRIDHLFPWIKLQEASHGLEYARAWEIVHEKQASK